MTDARPSGAAEPTRSNTGSASASSEMAQQPEEEVPDEDCLRLHRDDSSNGSGFLLRHRLIHALESAGLMGIDHVDVVFDDDDPANPALVLLPISEDETGLANNPRQVRYPKDSAEIRVPPALLGEREAGGSVGGRDLGLDLEHYSNDDRLLFEPVIGDGILLLVPDRFESGELYSAPMADEAEPETDPETRNPGALEHEEYNGQPLGAEAVTATAKIAGVDTDELVDALRILDDVFETVPWETITTDALEPLEVGEQRILFVEPVVWDLVRWHAKETLEHVGDEADPLLDVAEQAHLSVARDAVRASRAEEYRNFDTELSAVVRCA